LLPKGVSLPAVNTCQPLALFERGGLGGAAAGSICVDDADFTVVFHYTFHSCVGAPGSWFESATCRLQLASGGTLPTVSSSCRGTANGSGFLEVNDAILEFCDGGPVLGGGGAQCAAGDPYPRRTMTPSPAP